ncbi:MAG: UDP-3-O-[3-hydroxymyristoyl] N-acetylglucosamine deacetylase [Cellvibrionales bacterium TMED49]|nr:UDP-3-O-[3-hydroxymyristoyl] N-acetylglucosamine deacetylase [Porticoccaceae bacterium]OUU38857.1 MAG: UDP-3-O-[3-hydroxymyristoyl] N-acetylglucosamine deacetylase [Cellvibrionales bacterium TMED49]
MVKQRTLKNTIRASGVGLHSGKRVALTLRPADEGTGIIFRRVDMKPVVEIPALAENVIETKLSTTLMSEGACVSTVEHLLSALAGFGVDNLKIDLTGDEVPILDGSAAPFVFLLQSAGIIEQREPKTFVRVKKVVQFEHEEKTVRFSPYKGFKLNFEINYDHPVFQNNFNIATFELSSTSFVKEISRARTFGFLREYDFMKSQGLAKGGSLENAIVIDEDRIVNKGGLRYDDEFVKHKILDAIGDLYLMGRNLLCEFTAYKSGHTLNNASLRELILREDAWELVTFERNNGPAPIKFSTVS